MRSTFACLLLFASLFVAGCSGSDGGTTTGGDPTPPGGALLGRAQSDVPMVGAQVQLIDSSGQSMLADPLIAGANGLFKTAQVPRNSFRIVVTPVPATARAAQDLAPLASEVRNYDGEMVGVNFVTNLVSLYLAAHPELSLPEAEQRVRAFLQIPEGVDLGTGLDADSGWFSRTVFARRAAENGGVQAYSQALVAQVDTGPPVPFVLAAEGESSILSGLASKVAVNLLSDPLKIGLKDTFGWCSSLAGFNIGGTSMRQISNQLTQISQQIAQIQAEIALQTLTNEYTTDQGNLSFYFPTIDTTSDSLSNTADAFANQPAVVDPVTGPPDEALILQLQGQTNPTWDAMAVLFMNYLLGVNGAPNNMTDVYSGIVMDSVGAVSVAANYQGVSLRSNALVTQLQDQMNLYMQEASKALNLYAETAHLVTRDPISGNFSNNAVQLTDTWKRFQVILASMRQSMQQLPVLLPSDDVLVDADNGVTWYLTLQGPDTYDNIQNGSKIVTGPYGSKKSSGTRFTVATQAQLDALRHRLHGATPTVGNPTQTLSKLGFLGIPATTNLKVWMYSPNYNMGFGKQNPHAYTYELNTGNTTDHNTFTDTDPYYYLVAIPFPGDAEQDPSTPLLSSGKPGTLSVQAVSSTQLKAVATNNPVSSGGTFTSDGGTRSVKPVTVTRASDDLTQYVVWTSSNVDVADISNLDGTQGQITWHPNVVGGLQPVTFTASFLGVPSASLLVNPPNPAPVATLVSVQVLPTNLLYGLPARAEYYQAVGFYSDNTAVNLNAQATWSVVDAATNAPIDPSQAGFTTNEPNLLVISPTLTTSRMTVRATFGGVTGTANIEVPVPNP